LIATAYVRHRSSCRHVDTKRPFAGTLRARQAVLLAASFSKEMYQARRIVP
jgi:hypothetical protein